MHRLFYRHDETRKIASAFLNCSKGKALFTPVPGTAHNFQRYSLAGKQAYPTDESEHYFGLFLAAKIKSRPWGERQT
jgi:hypothetical protein